MIAEKRRKILAKELSIAARAKNLFRKISAGMNNAIGINSSPKSIHGKLESISAELTENITSDRMHDVNVKPSMIRIDELRARKNFSFILKKGDPKISYITMDYNIIPIFENASFYYIKLLVLTGKEYIL